MPKTASKDVLPTVGSPSSQQPSPAFQYLREQVAKKMAGANAALAYANGQGRAAAPARAPKR